ncbi:hypothetical protein [Lacticaseibacillus saniviri]|uniref:hypothetical protein n=1 Tax=Lacticaseibacillus saniviri TaxID=931533 RepID=UPI0006D027CA|nr:hypothetical protein [Lacticaseibacillus saniviri]
MPADAATFVTDISQQQWHVFDVNWDRDSTGGTLTYRLSNATSNGKSPIVEKVHWTDADINKIFFNNVAPAQEKVRVGFTGTTGDLYEANVLAFRTIPGIVNANGTETLTKNGSPVNSVAAVTTNDQLQYNFNINYDNDSQESWTTAADGTLTLTFTKNKYFKLMNSQVALTHADGSPVTNADGSQAYAKLSLAKTSSQAGFADDPTKVIVSGIPGFIKGSSETGSQTLKFSINTIVDTISNSEIPSNSQSLYSDDTGVVAGDNAQVHLENPDNNSDPFTIQYSIKTPVRFMRHRHHSMPFQHLILLI